MTASSPAPRAVSLSALIVAAGLTPLLLYWHSAGRAPSVSVKEAQAALARPAAPALLLDVRTPAQFARRHVPGSRNLPYAALTGEPRGEAVPAELRDRERLVICDSGMLSGLAARHLLRLDVKRAASVRGGIDAWAVEAREPSLLPRHTMSGFEQWVAVLTAFAVKPTYMVLSLGLIIVLRRSSSSDLAALRWGLIAFLAGEAACAVNYLVFSGRSEFTEYLHAYGMAVSFGFVAYAMFEGLDKRLVHFSGSELRCAALGLCHRCIKHDATTPCGLKRLFQVLIPATLVVGAMPLTADFRPVSYEAIVLGSPIVYAHSLIEQAFELRYCPLLALVLVAISWLVLLRGRDDAVARSKVWLAAALGPLSFALVRFLLLAGWSENLVWKDAWEEITELLFVAGTACVLWFFRKGLFPERRSAAPTTTAS